jgi:hypothetical protein
VEDPRLEVKEALKRIKGPDDVPIEVWRCFRDVAIVWLTKKSGGKVY